MSLSNRGVLGGLSSLEPSAMSKIDPDILKSETVAVRQPAPAASDAAAISARLMAIDGVEGVGMPGRHRLLVYISTPDVRLRLPKNLDGFDIEVECTGPIRTL